MPEITILRHNNRKVISAQKGENLFTLLRENGFPVYSPCGGKGTCGKCQVHIRGSGDVTSCLYHIEGPLEVILPDLKTANILTSQHALTKDLAFQPGRFVYLTDHPYGLAIDIGTTTLVFYLVDLYGGILLETRSMLNPQAPYGHDVIARIQFAGSREGLDKLHHLIIDAINLEAEHMLKSVGSSTEDLVRITVAGNNTMLHLLLGVDPSPMGQAPYTPRFTRTQARPAYEKGLKCHPGAELLVLPSVSAFVGSDIVAGLGSIQEDERKKPFLFADLGTNGELALSAAERVWCCATAAGPVFEGANISCGMGAVEGAISGFKGRSLQVLGDEKPAGICGSGLVDIIAWMLEHGKIDHNGLLKEKFVVVPSDQSATGKEVCITQDDVRQVQLAKSAIASGIILLVKHAGLQLDEVDVLYLAGGFGNYLNVNSAMRIGMLPAQLKGKVISLGNASGTGALLALRSEIYPEILSEIINKTNHIELSEDEDFPMEFAMNMNFGS